MLRSLATSVNSGGRAGLRANANAGRMLAEREKGLLLSATKRANARVRLSVTIFT
jgi:hypothetical protein